MAAEKPVNKRLAEYQETKVLTDPAGIPLNVETFQQYLEIYGPERAAGYRDAIAHMLSQVYELVRYPGYYTPTSISEGSPINIKNGVKELRHEKVLLLKHIDTVLRPSSDIAADHNTRLEP